MMQKNKVEKDELEKNTIVLLEEGKSTGYTSCCIDCSMYCKKHRNLVANRSRALLVAISRSNVVSVPIRDIH